MINDRIFAEGFRFTTFSYKKFKYNDVRAGAKMHFIAYMTCGSAKLVTEKENIYVSEGEVFYIPKGLRYESYWYGEPNIEFASLGFEFLPAFNAERFMAQTINTDKQTLKREIIYLAKKGATSSEDIGALYTLLGELIPQMQLSSADRKSEFIIKVKRYISLNPQKNVSEIAKHFAVSESGLYSTFKKHSEQSISEYRNQIVMNTARDVLTSSDTPIEEISESLGFSSGSYFRKCFKLHFGISPRDMRKKNAI